MILKLENKLGSGGKGVFLLAVIFIVSPNLSAVKVKEKGQKIGMKNS